MLSDIRHHIQLASETVAGMPRVEFRHPEWMLLCPLLIGTAWWIARRSLGGLQGAHQFVALCVRGAVIALICSALAEPSLKWKSDNLAVIAVRDFSRSVPAEQQRLANDFLAGSLARMRPHDLFGQVTTAEDAFVQSNASATPHLEIAHVGGADATNLRSGVQLARALVPSNAAGRVLLISDGNETVGSLLEAAQHAAAAGVPLDIATVSYDRSRAVHVKDLVVPSLSREDDVLPVRVVIESGRACDGLLSLTLNGVAVDLDRDSPAFSMPVHVDVGPNAFTIPVRVAGAPVQRFRANFDPFDRDLVDIPELLAAEAVSFASRNGKVLVVTEDVEAVKALTAALATDGVTVHTRPADGAPANLEELAGYDAIVLANEPASNFSQVFQENLVRAVRDTGAGLIVLGGPHAFGAGGWIGSPLEEALPVQLDPPQRRQMPMGALALIIDRSGSMGGTVQGSGLSQQQIANEAAVLGVRSLSRFDQVTVIAFSSDAKVVVPLTLCSDQDSIARRIRAIGSGGGTHLFPALDEARRQLEKSPAAVRHAIILTDGRTNGTVDEGLAKIRELRAKGISVSAVAIGDISDNDLLRQLAAAGGGRSYGVDSRNSRAVLPQIFVKEAQTVRRALIWEGPAFAPKMGMPTESLRGIPSPLPALTGYVVTADRGGLSTVGLRGVENDPLLAQWQHGLGRVTAFTSDATARWDSAWLSWDSFDAFWKRQLAWTMRPSGDARARVETSIDGDNAKITVELFDGEGERLHFAEVAGRAIHPGSDEATPITLRQTGPGRYEGSVPVRGTGVHVLAMTYGTPGNSERAGVLRAAIVRRAGEEVRSPTPDRALLQRAAEIGNGRVYRLEPSGANLWVRDHLKMPEESRAMWLFAALAAIGLFVIDVGVRRIAIDPEYIKAWLAGLFLPAKVKQTNAQQSLATAKRRAAQSITERGTVPSGAAPSPRPPRVPTPPPPTSPQSTPTEQTPKSPESPQPSEVPSIDRLRAAKRRARGSDGSP